MPSNKVTKRIKNVWTEEDMQSTLALVNSTTQPDYTAQTN